MARRAAHFTILALDNHGRRRREGGDPFVVSIRGPGAVTTSVRDATDGTYSVGWVANVSGTYWIVVSLYGEHISGSPFSAQVSVPHADARSCRLAGLGLRQAVAGDGAQFRIDFADVAGRAVPAESLDLALDLEGGGGRRDAADAAGFALGGLAALADGPEGAYHARYAIGRAGVYELHVRLRSSGEALPGSPFTLHVSPAPAHAPTTELPIDMIPRRSSAGTADTAVIRTVDRLHNACVVGGEGLTADIVPNASGKSTDAGWDDGPIGVGGLASSDVRVAVRDIGDGSYEVRWNGERRGMYRLSVRLRGAHLGGSPVALRMLSGRPHPDSCAMSGEGLRHAVAGKEALLIIACKDRFGNPVDADKRTRMWIELLAPRAHAGRRKAHFLSGSVALATSVSTRTPGDNAIDYEDGDERGLQACEALWADDGLMEVRYTTTRAGSFDVVLWCEHEGDAYELLHATDALMVDPQTPSLFHSVIVHAKRLQGCAIRAGTRMQLPLRLVDTYGNTCIEPHTVSVALVGPDGTGRVTPLSARPLTLADLEDAVEHAPGPSGRVHFKEALPKSPRSPHSPKSPKSPRATTCAVSQSEGSPSADGVFEGHLTSPVADAYAAAPEVLRQAAATHLIEYTCGVAGEFRVSVAIANKQLDISPLTFYVIAGQPHGSRSELVPPPMPVLTHAPCEFLVQACDRWGNRLEVGGATVAARTNGPGAMQCVVIDNSDGTYTITLVASCSGEYKVIASLDGHQVIGSPHGLSVVHAGALPAHQRASAERAAAAREASGRGPRKVSPEKGYLPTTPRGLPPRAAQLSRGGHTHQAVWPSAELMERDEHVAVGDGPAVPVTCGSMAMAKGSRAAPLATPLRSSASAPSVGSSGGSKAAMARGDGCATPRSSTTPRGGTTSEQRYHAALKAASPRGEARYLQSTASRGGTPEHASANRAVVAHYGRMCNPKQAFAISESRIVERDVGAFEGASTPRGRDSSRLTPSRMPRGTAGARSQPLASAGLHVHTSHGSADSVHNWTVSKSAMGSVDVSDDVRMDGIAAAGASFVAGPTEVATGKVAVLLVCACDAQGVPVPHGGDPFIASVHGPAASRTEMRDLLDGRYELRVATPNVSGDFRVAVTLHGRAIGGSPHALHVLAPIAHHDFIDASGTALELASAGEVATFELVANDAHGRRVTYGGEQYSVRLRRLHDLAETSTSPTKAKGGRGRGKSGRGSGGASGGGRSANSRGGGDGGADGQRVESGHERIFYGRVEDRRDGSYACHYNVGVSGRYQLSVHDLKSGKEVKDSPWSVLVAPGATYAPSSFLRGRELGKGIAGELLSFVLHACDARGNQQLFGAEPWVAQIVGPYPNTEPLEVPLTDRGDGTYKGQLTMALSGEYSLAITLRGAHARGSPMRIGTVASGVHAPRCVAEGVGLRAGFKGQVASFAIVARDAFGNRVSRGAHGYNVRVRPPLSATRAPDVYVADKNDGTCSVEWLPTTRGRHVVSITLGGVPIEGSDYICHVV